MLPDGRRIIEQAHLLLCQEERLARLVAESPAFAPTEQRLT